MPWQRSFRFGYRSGKGLDRSGGTFWPSGEPLEPQDAAVHLRPPESDPHHRRPRDDPRAAADAKVPAEGRRAREPGVAGRHEAAGVRRHRAARRSLRDALRQRSLAGRHADQLPHDPQPARPARGIGRPAQFRRDLYLFKEDAVGAEPRIPQDVSQPQRYPHHEPPARVPAGCRSAQGKERDWRGPQAGHHHPGA